MYDDHQCSGYDVECCSWSNLPDEDFALADDYDWTIGQFVWTGFDYLGEPSPYSTDSWPSHSSVFGIIDLASSPKTVSICTAAYGTSRQIPCMSFRTGRGRAGKGRILRFLFTPAIPVPNCSSTERVMANSGNLLLMKAVLWKVRTPLLCSVAIA